MNSNETLWSLLDSQDVAWVNKDRIAAIKLAFQSDKDKLYISSWTRSDLLELIKNEQLGIEPAKKAIRNNLSDKEYVTSWNEQNSDKFSTRERLSNGNFYKWTFSN